MNAVDIMQGWVDALVEPVGPTLARAIFAVLAGSVLLVFVIAVRAGRIGVFRSAILLASAALFAALSADLNLFLRLNQVSFLTRIRLLMGILSFVVLLVTFEAVRRSHVQERYAILWMFTGLMLMLCAVFVRVLDFFCALLGMQYVTFVVTVIFTFLLMVAFHFSVSLSRLMEDRSRIAQRCAQLEARLDQLEKRSLQSERPSNIQPD
ncbi:MAG: DUF2304 domain-containing protein [Kiritimatiellae bacterium]|nr:DUF2304 domain-containing protein [Kiritimatiellia bacterium]MDW8458249.1 DUF2304 domain-containing protein [Verrucomicrobiota bacterium]